jgi:hypothetical protein
MPYPTRWNRGRLTLRNIGDGRTSRRADVICQIERTPIESGLPDGFDDLVSLRFPQQPRTNRHMSGLYFTAAGSVSEALCIRALRIGPAG